MTDYHIVTTYGKGGNSTKSTLILMLSTYLWESSQTILIIDLTTTPQVGKTDGTNLYSCFGNLFGIHQPFDSVEGCDYLRVPVSSNQRKSMLIVRGGGAERNDWESQTGLVEAIKRKFSREYEISHLILETNLQLNAPGVELMFDRTIWSYETLWIWTTWLRDVLHNQDLYSKINALQVSSAEGIKLGFVHSPYLDKFPKSDQRYSDMPAIKGCYELAHLGDTDVAQLERTIGCRAQEATEGVLFEGDEYWQFVYQDFFEQNSRPRNLLPVYRRSETFYTVMTSQFRGIPGPIQHPDNMKKMLDDNSDRLYTDIYHPFFVDFNV